MTPCILWPGQIDRHGYGRLAGRLAHRLVYLANRGPIGELQIDHLCRVRACINPDHLEPVPGSVNTDRAYPATKGHCINGHRFDEENTYYRLGNGRRSCRACNREAQVRYKARRAA